MSSYRFKMPQRNGTLANDSSVNRSSHQYRSIVKDMTKSRLCVYMEYARKKQANADHPRTSRANQASSESQGTR